jgi:hypothetical protein
MRPPDEAERRPWADGAQDAHGGGIKDSVYGLHIFPQHAKLLAASAIDPAVARERGYVSADSKKQVERYGFPPWQCRTGLLIPMRRADGSVWGYQLRSDTPRVSRQTGKAFKYETPASQRNGIDVPPGIRDSLGDPSVPLLVTEGTRKADSSVSHGIACVALPGVWGWRGTNGKGGKLAVADWHDIALNGRRVVLAFDSDVTVKPAVRAALGELAGYLATKGATVEYLHLPDAGDGKTGLDDYLVTEGAAGIWALVRPDPPALRDERLVSTPRAVLAHPHTPPALAADQDILARLVRALRVCGLVGEERSARLLYLAVASHILDDPVSVAVKGLSSAGKSFTVETVLRFLPPESLIVMTAMSERALIYMKDDFCHRTLVLYEATALREEREKTESNITAYLVRSLLSEGQIRYPVTIKDGGELVTKTIVKEGPTNFVVTTTATSLHGENETRMLSLPADDSQAQTKAVLRALAGGKPATLPDFGEWHQFRRWLGTANHHVVIPYAGYLADAIPPVAVRLRRDFRAVLRLIEMHAIMHQRTRENRGGAIVATEADYLAVRELVAEIIADAIGATVLPATRETVEAVAKLADTRSLGVTVHDVAAMLGIERSRAQRRLKGARERGYLKNLEDKRGKPARYLPDEPLPGEVAILPPRVCSAQCTPPCAAFCHGAAGQDGVCGCAPTAEEIESAAICTECGEPLDSVLAGLGETAHPWCDPGPPMTAAELAAAGFPARLAEDTAS